jgi:hypothetical protein
MYVSRYIQFVNFPAIPDSLTADLCRDFGRYTAKAEYGDYVWSDSFNQDINTWCKKHVCQDMYWGFQIMKGDIPKHKDIGTLIKLSYVLDTGGDEVHTKFWSDDGVTLLTDYVIPLGRWHIFKADVVHSIEDIIPGSVRFSVTGRIF